VKAELKLGTPELGSSLAVAPEGSPEVERVTACLKSPMASTEMTALVQSPCTTVPASGRTLTLKSGAMGGALTVSV